MSTYEFLCKTAQGKEVRGECNATGVEDLKSMLRETGLTLISCNEKSAEKEATPPAAPEFAKEIASALQAMNHAPAYMPRAVYLQPGILFFILAVASLVFYAYLDSRIDKLEQLNFARQTNVTRSVSSHEKSSQGLKFPRGRRPL